jgi:alpha-D-ribose 1-methylphosphonate 5-triphosphate synthase subunit PhnH
MATTSSRVATTLRTAATLQVSLDPIRDTQAIFRTTLNALSWPGAVRGLPVEAAGAPVNPWAAGLLITLLDHEVTFAVEPFQDGETLERFVRQRTNAATAPPSEADFVLAAATGVDPELPLRLKRGSLAFPDDGATLVLMVDALGQPERGGLLLGLSGPGVSSGHTLRVTRLAAEVIAARNEAVSAYPCGIDLLLVDSEGRLAALPRSTEITIAEEGS